MVENGNCAPGSVGEIKPAEDSVDSLHIRSGARKRDLLIIDIHTSHHAYNLHVIWKVVGWANT